MTLTVKVLYPIGGEKLKRYTEIFVTFDLGILPRIEETLVIDDVEYVVKSIVYHVYKKVNDAPLYWSQGITITCH